jgi:hypothetical protein
MPSLPPRWYRDVDSAQDIKDLADHLSQVCQLPQRDREFRGGIRITGEAYGLSQIIFAERRRDFLTRLFGFLSDPITQTAKDMGGMFLALVKSHDHSTISNLRYVLSHYCGTMQDSGHSITVGHYDGMQMDNHYWDPPTYY